jgi:hypothetical protein
VPPAGLPLVLGRRVAPAPASTGTRSRATVDLTVPAAPVRSETAERRIPLPVVAELTAMPGPVTAAGRHLPLPAAPAPAPAPAGSPHPATPHPHAVAHPAAAPARRAQATGREPTWPARQDRAAGGVDVDRLTDKVAARLLKRMAIERERRGG